MATLLLRLAGPMQSWGTRSAFDDRDTERFPSKSGVIGLLCAALGRPRDAPLEDLASLSMAARADRPGVVERDFQTASQVPTARALPDGSSPTPPRTVVSWRHYLADGIFLVGVEGELAQIEELYEALQRPCWPLCLGRKGYVPAAPVFLPDGLRMGDLRTEIRAYPWLVGREDSTVGRRLREAARVPLPDALEVEWECAAETLADEMLHAEPRQDVPVSFEYGRREHRVRWVSREWIPFPVSTGGVPTDAV
jgi:CRISPR system Cascade subunit CasD